MLDFEEDMDSVQHFLENECIVTQFDTDTVKVTDFMDRYEKFCLDHRLQQIEVTRELMASYGL